MVKVDLADRIVEEAEKQALDPVEKIGSQERKVEPANQAKSQEKRRTTRKRTQPKTPEVEIVDEKPSVPRRTAWLREDHLDRLEALKRREKDRLRADPEKRLAVTTLIDEAIEKYLEEME